MGGMDIGAGAAAASTPAGDKIVTPGEIIGDASSFTAGYGAYIANRYVRAALVGRCRIVAQSPLDSSADQRPVVEVVGLKPHGVVPQPGSIVLARVTKIMPKVATADIICVDKKAVTEKFSGTIRQQDVRATEIDKVDMYQSFRPGDIVKASVLSLGDARSYYLSTAKSELGVVSAQSKAGATLIPISSTEMQCQLSGQVEQRKVAQAS